MLVQRVSANTRGRDLVAGDIHGEISLLVAALERINFDPAADRLFLVGDLIDRGRESQLVAQILSMPWAFSVRGNHEDMLLEIYAEGNPTEEVVFAQTQYNGMAWWRDVAPEQRRDILAAIARLPLAIELETPRGLVGLVHADVPFGSSWQQFTAALEEGEPGARECCLWGRERIQLADCTGVAGVGRVFVGHTPQWGGLQRYGNVYAVDTGAVFGAAGAAEEGSLTLASIIGATQVLTAPRSRPGLLDLRVSAQAPSNSFGAYSEGAMA